jgi:hypothetical protein
LPLSEVEGAQAVGPKEKMNKPQRGERNKTYSTESLQTHA